jgi:prepilin-type N-terminal cleavage/methylation domain-containing protein/prepilin-type processing-associated H-X9-DG protein
MIRVSVCRKRRGFTLIEILVAIVIISILAGLVYTIYPIATEHGRRATCASNLHQIGAALIDYAADNDGFAPPYNAHEWRREWGDQLPWESSEGLVEATGPYVGDNRMWLCPSDPYRGKDDYTWHHWHMWTSYIVYFGNGEPPWPYPLPAGWKPSGGGDPDLPAGQMYSVAADANMNWGGQHRGGYNVLFWDGHVETHRAAGAQSNPG